MSFPVGGQYFVDLVRNGLKAVPPAERAQAATELLGSIGQA